jgi:hypothetical protein
MLMVVVANEREVVPVTRSLIDYSQSRSRYVLRTRSGFLWTKMVEHKYETWEQSGSGEQYRGFERRVCSRDGDNLIPMQLKVPDQQGRVLQEAGVLPFGSMWLIFGW